MSDGLARINRGPIAKAEAFDAVPVGRIRLSLPQKVCFRIEHKMPEDALAIEAANCREVFCANRVMYPSCKVETE
jgi:hypothetical protein